jgi:hypothetical protein
MILMAVLSWYHAEKRSSRESLSFRSYRRSRSTLSRNFRHDDSGAGNTELRAAAMNLRTPYISGFRAAYRLLDNAPTYLTFTAMASGIVGSSAENLKGLLGRNWERC